MNELSAEETSEELVAAIENGLLAEDDATEDPSSGDTRPRDVAAVLDEIGAEEAVAHLEARIQEMEQELERRDQRQREADGSRRGEFELMRARIDDALELVKSSTEEQREAWSRLESKFSDLVAGAEETSRTQLDELRQELSPKVAEAIAKLEETEARIRGELRSVTEAADQRTSQHAERAAALENDLRRTTSELAERLDAHENARSGEAERLERMLDQRVSQVEEVQTTAAEELTARLSSLRRELDAAAGELRATVNLEANELGSQLGQFREELEDRLNEQVEDLEQRWIAGTRDIARRIEEVAGELRRQVAGEREARRSALDETSTRLDEVAGVVEELHTGFQAAQTRRHGEDDHIRRDLDEISSRLDVLQSKVASAVGQIASQLTNRVATLSSDQEAFREAAGRREERLAALEPLQGRVGEIASDLERLQAAVTSQRDERPVPSPEDVRAIRQELADVSGDLGPMSERLGDLASAVDGLEQEAQERAALRQEVRELAARSAELGERLNETERLARAAGKAIASAVRRSRSAQQRTKAEDQPSFFQADPPSEA